MDGRILQLETAGEEGSHPVSVLLGVSLEVVHVARVLQPPLLHPPAPPPGLCRHRGHEPPGDQRVALRVDEHQRPPAPVLVLDPVAGPAHLLGPGVQLPELRRAKGQDLTEAAAASPVDSEVRPDQGPGMFCSEARAPGPAWSESRPPAPASLWCCPGRGWRGRGPSPAPPLLSPLRSTGLIFLFYSTMRKCVKWSFCNHYLPTCPLETRCARCWYATAPFPLNATGTTLVTPSSVNFSCTL